MDAPVGARGIFRLGAARSRVLTCIRPLMRPSHAAGPYGSSRIGSITIWRAPGRLSMNWFFRSRLIDRRAIPSVRPSYAFDNLAICPLCGHDRSSVYSTFCKQGPSRACNFVGERHSYQHRRLAVEYPVKPRSSWRPSAHTPRSNCACPDDQ